MAAAATTPAGINPNPRTNSEHVRNWQRLAQFLSAGGIGLDANGSLASPVSELTTKGDLLSFSSEPARLAVGADGRLLTADSSQATGLRWALPVTSNASDSVLTATVNLSVTSSALSGVYQIVGPTLTLAAAGTYLITFAVHGALVSGMVGDQLTARLYDTTAAAAIPNTELRLCTIEIPTVADDHTATGALIFAPEAATAVRLEAAWTTAGGGTVTNAPVVSDSGGRTRLTAVRIA